MRHRSLLCALLVVAGLVVTGVTRSDAAESPEQLKAACEKGKAIACDAFEEGPTQVRALVIRLAETQTSVRPT